VKGDYGRVWGKGNADYGGMVQSSQEHVAPCVKVVEWGFGTRALRMLAGFWAGIPVKDPRHRETLFVASYDTQGYGGRILTPHPQG